MASSPSPAASAAPLACELWLAPQLDADPRVLGELAVTLALEDERTALEFRATQQLELLRVAFTGADGATAEIAAHDVAWDSAASVFRVPLPAPTSGHCALRVSFRAAVAETADVRVCADARGTPVLVCHLDTGAAGVVPRFAGDRALPWLVQLTVPRRCAVVLPDGAESSRVPEPECADVPRCSALRVPGGELDRVTARLAPVAFVVAERGVDRGLAAALLERCACPTLGDIEAANFRRLAALHEQRTPQPSAADLEWEQRIMPAEPQPDDATLRGAISAARAAESATGAGIALDRTYERQAQLPADERPRLGQLESANFARLASLLAAPCDETLQHVGDREWDDAVAAAALMQPAARPAPGRA